MIKTIIIGSKNVDRLHQLLSDYFENMIIIGKAKNVEASIDLIEKRQFDIAFVEIFLDDGSCFDVLKLFNCDLLNLIFVASNHNYAIKAIKFSALDYLLEPIKLEDLKFAIQKLIKNRLKVKRNLHLIDTKFTKAKSNFKQIVLPGRDNQIVIQLRNIIRIEAKGSYVIIFLENNRSHIVVNSLKYYENLLPSDIFYRIHKSHLINVYKIEQIANGRSSRVLLIDGSELCIAARRKSAFNRFVKQIV